MNQGKLPIGSMWYAWHSQGADIVLVLGDPKDDRRSRTFVPCLVLTTGAYVETWAENFSTWERLL